MKGVLITISMTCLALTAMFPVLTTFSGTKDVVAEEKMSELEPRRELSLVWYQRCLMTPEEWAAYSPTKQNLSDCPEPEILEQVKVKTTRADKLQALIDQIYEEIEAMKNSSDRTK